KNNTYKNNYLKTAEIWSRFFPLMELIGDICALALLGFGGYLVISGFLDVGALVAFFSLVWYILGPLMNLGFVINQFSQAKASGERLLEILEAPEDIVEKADARDTEIKGHVTFNNVSLTYTENDDPALKNISFDAPPAKTIGLIGATGSGNTSITQLIPRFYEPEKGEVLVDKRPVSDYRVKALRKHIGFVIQKPFFFSTNIKVNIRIVNIYISVVIEIAAI